MLDVKALNDFSRIVEILNCRVDYDTLIITGDLSFPAKVRGQLTVTKAEWWIEFGASINAGSESIAAMIELCTNYRMLAAAEDPITRIHL